MSVKQKIKNGFNGLRNLYTLCTKEDSLKNTNKEVYFYLKDSRIIPYYFFIIYAFLDKGYKVYLKCNFKFLAGFYGVDYQLLRLKGVHLIWKVPQNKSTIVLTDDRNASINDDRMVYLNPDAFNGKMDAAYFPFSLHPNLYISRKFESLPELRQAQKKMRIFFSGNTFKDAYDNPDIRKKYGLANRYQIISFLLNNLNSDELKLIVQKDDWNNVWQGEYLNKLVLNKWEWSPHSSKNIGIRVKYDEWLPTLAAAEFFLACPGVVIPQSHNAIEAMAVGTIPILSYKDYFHPALEDGKNCIHFKDEEDLLKKLHQVFSMSAEEIRIMSDNVKHYYDQNLSFINIVADIECKKNKMRELYFYNEMVH